jgi:hypothetical protein
MRIGLCQLVSANGANPCATFNAVSALYANHMHATPRADCPWSLEADLFPLVKICLIDDFHVRKNIK